MMTLKIGKREEVLVASLFDAVMVYTARRRNSGEGASTFPQGIVRGRDRERFTIDYNGRVVNQRGEPVKVMGIA